MYFQTTRRSLLKQAAFFGASAGMPGLWSRTAAAAGAPSPASYAAEAAKRIEAAKQKAGAMETLRIGSTEVLAILDSAGAFPVSLFAQADAHPEWTAYMPDGRFPSAVRTYVIRSGGRTALVDAGYGEAKGGRLMKCLAALGIAPESVSDVLLTHLHGDHIGGLLLADGRPAFPKARLHLSAPEWEAWIEKGSEGAPAAVEAARRTFAAYEAAGIKAQRFSFGDAVLPGVVAQACCGHTAGHVRFDVMAPDGKAAALVIAGDFLHVQPLQSRYPSASTRYDVHPEEAARTREALLKSLAASGTPVAGMHFAFIGHVKALEGGGYAIEPAAL